MITHFAAAAICRHQKIYASKDAAPCHVLRWIHNESPTWVHDPINRWCISVAEHVEADGKSGKTAELKHSQRCRGIVNPTLVYLVPIYSTHAYTSTVEPAISYHGDELESSISSRYFPHPLQSVEPAVICMSAEILHYNLGMPHFHARARDLWLPGTVVNWDRICGGLVSKFSAGHINLISVD